MLLRMLLTHDKFLLQVGRGQEVNKVVVDKLLGVLWQRGTTAERAAPTPTTSQCQKAKSSYFRLG